MVKRTCGGLVGACVLMACLSSPCSAYAEGSGSTTTDFPHEFSLADFAVTLERSVYDMDCPDYTVTIRGDGTGESVCGYAGAGGELRADFAVPPETLHSILKTLYLGDFFRLSPEYSIQRSVSVDSSGIVRAGGRAVFSSGRAVFSVRIGEQTKSVTVLSADHPDVLDDLEQQIDKASLGVYRELMSKEEE